ELIRRHWSLSIHHPCRPDAPTLPGGSKTHPLYKQDPGPNIHRHINNNTIDHATLPGGVTAPHSSRRGDYLGAV
ncbi:hypothetical protein LINPERPRIM_LOCUS43784, partial [Linum perenne]